MSTVKNQEGQLSNVKNQQGQKSNVKIKKVKCQKLIRSNVKCKKSIRLILTERTSGVPPVIFNIYWLTSLPYSVVLDQLIIIDM